MHVRQLHPWDLSPAEAAAVQRELAGLVLREGGLDRAELVCGVDTAVRGKTVQAACVVLDFPRLQVVDWAFFCSEVSFPYLPGLLSFHEVPALIPAFTRLDLCPDVILADGHGVAHPRRFGLASHIGLVTGLPTIGCAKSKLVGAYREPDMLRGSREHLYDQGEVIGSVVRTREGVKPVFVSVGHRASLESCVEVVLRCAPRYRIPEPLRAAHRVAAAGSPG